MQHLTHTHSLFSLRMSVSCSAAGNPFILTTPSAFITTVLLHCILVIFSVATVIFGFLFWKRRRLFPLNGRNPLLTLGCSLFVILYGCMYIFQSYLALVIPCWTLVITSVTALGFSFIYTIRVFKLWFQHKISECRSSPVPKLEDWFVRNRFMVENRVLLW
jgi:hypothetical protein